ncbi:MAG: hypothetical protein ACPHAO_09870, partial [Paracoccaceae bacterium]
TGGATGSSSLGQAKPKNKLAKLCSPPINRLADADRPRQTAGLHKAKRAASSSPSAVGLGL